MSCATNQRHGVRSFTPGYSADVHVKLDIVLVLYKILLYTVVIKHGSLY